MAAAVAASAGAAIPAWAHAVPAAPVAAIDWGIVQTLVALSAGPVASPELSEYREQVVEPVLPADTVDIGARLEPNLEVLLQLKPRLILLPPGYRAMVDVFGRLAPTHIIDVYGGEGDPIERISRSTGRLGELVGAEGRARQLVDRLPAALADARRLTGMRDGRGVIPLRFLDERHAIVFGANSLFSSLLRRLGLDCVWTGPANAWGYAIVGVEALASFPEAHLVSIGSERAVVRRLERSSFWRALPHAGKRMTELPPVWAFGTIPSALRFVEAFAEAAHAGG